MSGVECRHMTRKKKPGPKPFLRLDAAKLRRLRLERGWEIDDLVEIAKVSRTRLRELEAGINPGITLRTAHKLANAFGCSFKDFTEVADREAAS
jgi:transcriptional regulator with XRE-family HTH domain